MIKIMKKNMLRLLTIATLSLTAFIDPAFSGEPTPWQKGFQPAATPVMEHIADFHTLLLYIITAITLFVFALMIYIMVRFRAKANPEPSKTTHNTLIEVIWTVVPVIILIVIAVPSMKLLYYSDRTADPEMTIKVTGLQWYWNYTYMDDEDELSFDARMIQHDETEVITARSEYRRLLSTDNQLVLPEDTNIRILVTAGPDDVLHSFAVPAFGVKKDAVPGRINETWARIDDPGTYYGQCSELCGQGHAFMPSEIRVVTKEDFAAWMEFAKTQDPSYEEFLVARAGGWMPTQIDDNITQDMTGEANQ